MRSIAALLFACVAMVAPCFGQTQRFPTTAEVEKKQAKAKVEIGDALESFARAALQTDLPASPDARRERAAAILNQLHTTPTREAIRTAFDAIVVWPRNTQAAVWIIQYGDQAFNLGVITPRAYYAAKIEALYREHARSGGGNVPAIEWQEGLAELLTEIGRYQEAKEVVTNALTIRGDTRSRYLEVLAAVIERLNGDPKPLDSLVADCKPPDDYELGNQYCRDIATDLARRMVNLSLVNDRRAPVRLLLDVELDCACIVRDLADISHLDPEIAEPELLRIVRETRVPDDIRHSAAMFLSEIAKRGRRAREAVAWRDCSLHFRGVTVSPFPEDGWSQMVTYAKSPRTNVERCRDDDAAPACVAGELENREFIAMHDQEWAIARQSVEQFATWTLEHNLEIFDFAQAMLLLGEEQWRSGLKDEGTRTMEFALLLDPRISSGEAGELITRLGIVAAYETATPWKSPTTLDKPLPSVCPE